MLRARAGVEASRYQSTQGVRACHFVILFIKSRDRTGHCSSSSLRSFAFPWSAHPLLTRNNPATRDAASLTRSGIALAVMPRKQDSLFRPLAPVEARHRSTGS